MKAIHEPRSRKVEVVHQRGIDRDLILLQIFHNVLILRCAPILFAVANHIHNAAAAPAGADGLLFLPYLTGERLGAHRNARAQFFGITARHGLPHLHRAVMEGVAFSVARHVRIMEAASGQRMERVIASSGGARSRLWLEIKASIYDVPILVPEEAECGVVGCAVLAATATGRFARPADAVSALVRHGEEIRPNPAWTERYARMLPVFNSIYRNSQSQYDLLDELAR